ncbi:MAG: hypothetical protein QM831_06625 [Kofleriaceae bacterium]
MAAGTNNLVTQEQFDQLWRLIANGFSNIDTRFVGLETQMQRLRAEVRYDLGVMRAELHEDIATSIGAMEERLRADFFTAR